MSLNYDLHAHSYFSDGRLSPSELVVAAVQAGVDVLALTDHDTTHGIAEAQAAAATQPLRVLPGIEYSAMWQGHAIHLVGLDIDPQHPALQAALVAQQARRDYRVECIGLQLQQAGIADAKAGARALAGGTIVTRAHFAQYLVNNGHVPDFKTAFNQYLKTSKLPRQLEAWPSYQTVIELITEAGGVTVIAHPRKYGLTCKQVRLMARDFKAAGGVGLEVVGAMTNQNDRLLLARICQETGLEASVGSDFHGYSSYVKLGGLAALPTQCTPIWHRFES